MEKILTPVGKDGDLSIVKGSTQTVGQFCKEQVTSGLDIKESVNRPGHYFMCHDNGASLGPVTNQVELSGITEPVISEFKGAITEQNPTGFFFMLHQKGTGGAQVVTRFNA